MIFMAPDMALFLTIIWTTLTSSLYIESFALYVHVKLIVQEYKVRMVILK